MSPSPVLINSHARTWVTCVTSPGSTLAIITMLSRSALLSRASRAYPLLRGGRASHPLCPSHTGPVLALRSVVNHAAEMNALSARVDVGSDEYKARHPHLASV